MVTRGRSLDVRYGGEKMEDGAPGRDSPKFKEIAFPNFNQGSEGSSKRHKSSGSSSFNTESGNASINLNTTVADEDDVRIHNFR
ncbi:hypothetical protein Tco_0472427 [Tanacetum coccineum]